MVFMYIRGDAELEQTAACSETDVVATWPILFCLTKHDAEENGEQRGGQDAPLLDTAGDWGSCPTVTHCASFTLLTFMELAENGEKLR